MLWSARRQKTKKRTDFEQHTGELRQPMQTDTLPRTSVIQDSRVTRLATFRIRRGHRAGSIAGDQAQRHRRDLRRQQNRRGDDESFPRRRGRYRGRVVAHPGTGPLARGPDQRHVRTALPVGRHAAHRRHPGPGRTRADALRRAQGGARLRAVPRQPRPCPCRAQAGRQADADQPVDHARRRHAAHRSTSNGCAPSSTKHVRV